MGAKFPNRLRRTGNDNGDDGVDQDGEGAWEALLEELAKASKFTMGELRELDDEVVEKLAKELDLDLDALEAKADRLQKQMATLGSGADADVDLDEFEPNTVFSTAADSDDFQVGGAFTGMDRRN